MRYSMSTVHHLAWLALQTWVDTSKYLTTIHIQRARYPSQYCKSSWSYTYFQN